MVTRNVKDSSTAGYVDGLDRHYYEDQVGPASPFDTTHAFRIAAARAKDRARHNQVRAIRKADQEARSKRSLGQQIGDALSGTPGGGSRSIDGVEGAPDSAIKV